MAYFFSLFPILLFLIILILLDSFSLVKWYRLFYTILWGVFCCALCFFVYRWVNPSEEADIYFAPILEELFKGMMLLFLFAKRKTVFLIDSIIYGAAIGSGFALFENVFYSYLNPDMELSVAIFRGLSTAIMHAGVTALLAVMLHLLVSKEKNLYSFFVPAILPSIIIHILYNLLLLPPFYLLLASLFGPMLIIAVLVYIDEKNIGKWMESSVNNEVALLASIKKGQFLSTKAGKYLASIKEQFEPELAFDMYCYISLFLELSLSAKSNMMLREAGLPERKDPETDSKIKELYILKSRIGKTGELALSPIVRLEKVEKWMIDSLIG